MTWNDKENENSPIVRFEGVPIAPDQVDEKSRWRRFVDFITPYSKKWSKYGAGLGQEYVEAKVAHEKGHAAKLAAEASERHAEADAKNAQTVRVVNDELERIFKQDTPVELKKAQMATLLAKFPEIATQLEVVEKLIDKLHITKGASVEVRPLELEDSAMSDSMSEADKG